MHISASSWLIGWVPPGLEKLYGGGIQVATQDSIDLGVTNQVLSCNTSRSPPAGIVRGHPIILDTKDHCNFRDVRHPSRRTRPGANGRQTVPQPAARLGVRRPPAARLCVRPPVRPSAADAQNNSACIIDPMRRRSRAAHASRMSLGRRSGARRVPLERCPNAAPAPLEGDARVRRGRCPGAGTRTSLLGRTPPVTSKSPLRLRSSTEALSPQTTPRSYLEIISTRWPVNFHQI